jgi:ligand-binding sensor domain-containing protein
MKKNKTNLKIIISALSLIVAAYFGIANTIIPGKPEDIGIPAKKFFAATIDNNNNKWFLTELGLISFNGTRWTLHNDMKGKELRDIAFESGTGGTGFWIATGSGITSLKAPVEAGSPSASFTTDNAAILSNNVGKIVVGKNKIKWIGTEKGVAALAGDRWLDVAYDDLYPAVIFQEYPITSMATNPAGDSLYVATNGAGVARVFKNEVDGISGASVIAMWGPIIIPSDNVFSIFIEKNGVRWYGTDMGVGRHTGDNILEDWEVYTTGEGLVNDFVQAITADNNGNLWFGTKGGISLFDGTSFKTFTKDNGLNSNNILCLAVDSKGVVWIGTDDGVNSYSNGTFTSYR